MEHEGLSAVELLEREAEEKERMIAKLQKQLQRLRNQIAYLSPLTPELMALMNQTVFDTVAWRNLPAWEQRLCAPDATGDGMALMQAVNPGFYPEGTPLTDCVVAYIVVTPDEPTKRVNLRGYRSVNGLLNRTAQQVVRRYMVEQCEAYWPGYVVVMEPVHHLDTSL